jgi:hypothetical protein
LFGLAEGYSRLGQPEKARIYFERLVKDAQHPAKLRRRSSG